MKKRLDSRTIVWIAPGVYEHTAYLRQSEAETLALTTGVSVAVKDKIKFPAEVILNITGLVENFGLYSLFLARSRSYNTENVRIYANTVHNLNFTLDPHYAKDDDSDIKLFIYDNEIDMVAGFLPNIETDWSNFLGSFNLQTTIILLVPEGYSLFQSISSRANDLPDLERKRCYLLA